LIGAAGLYSDNPPAGNCSKKNTAVSLTCGSVKRTDKPGPKALSE